MLQRKPILWGIVSLLLVLFLASTIFADLRGELPFTDVRGDVWYYADVKEAYENELINGKTDTLFAPEDNMTAAEAVKLASCMHQLKKEGDVSLSAGVGAWYKPYVDYAKDNGLIDVDLDWNKKITRAGYMQIFARLITDEEAVLNDVPDDFIPDVKMSHPSANGIYKLYRAGVVQGMDSKRNCKPTSYIKRSEVAAILTRMMKDSSRIVFRRGANLTIRVQPKNAKGRLGSRVNLEVTVSGGKAPLSYQWEYLDEGSGDFKKSTSEGNTTNILKAPVEETVYKYRCVITDATGKQVISKTVKVEQSDADTLTVTKQPESKMGNIGEIVKLNVEVSGGKDPVTYQWEYSENMSGPFYKSEAIGNKTKELTVAIENKEYWYRCKIKDAAGQTVKSGRVLVKTGGDSDSSFRITSQPIDMAAAPGNLVMLGVAVTGGTPPYYYQWSYSENGRTNFASSKAEGNNSNTLKVRAEKKTYYYQCEIQDDTGKTLYSDVVKVTETTGAPFEIVRQPVGGYANYGEYFDLEVKVRGGREPYTYQWQRLHLGTRTFEACRDPGNNTERLKVVVDDRGDFRDAHRCVIKDADDRILVTDSVIVRMYGDKGYYSFWYSDFDIEKHPENKKGYLGEEVELVVELKGAKKPVEYWWFALRFGQNKFEPVGVGNGTNKLKVIVKNEPYYYYCSMYDKSYRGVVTVPVKVEKR